MQSWDTPRPLAEGTPSEHPVAGVGAWCHSESFQRRMRNLPVGCLDKGTLRLAQGELLTPVSPSSTERGEEIKGTGGRSQTPGVLPRKDCTPLFDRSPRLRHGITNGASK